MRCRSCATENPENNNFCGLCGRKLERLAPNAYFSDRHQVYVQNRNDRASLREDVQRAPEPTRKEEFAGPDLGDGDRLDRERRSVAAQHPTRSSRHDREQRTPDAVPPLPVSGYDRPQTQHEFVPPPPESAARYFRYDVQREPLHTSISGPSLLGLSEAPIDDTPTYLLDTEPTRSMSWRLPATLLVIAALVFLGWQMWAVKNGHASVLRWGAAPASEEASAKNAPIPSGDSNITPSNASNPAAGNDAAAMPQSDKAPGQEPSTASDATAPRSPDNDAKSSLAGSKPSDSADSASSNPNPKSADATGASASAGEADGDARTNASSSSLDKSTAAAGVPATHAKVSAATRAAAPDYDKDPKLLKAEQYIRGGNGIAQNCIAGLDYLRDSAENNPRARIQMAALYESGVCVAQDPVQAYRWFGLAKQLEPQNQWIERNRQGLWASMSDQERMRAQEYR